MGDSTIAGKNRSALSFIIDLFRPSYKKHPDAAAFRDVLGFYPHNYEYYKAASIHRSASFTKQNGSVVNNERLEFLGDAILDSVIADLLFHRFPNQDEGFLTQMRSKIVNGENLSRLAKKIGLNRLVITSTSSMSHKSIYGDAFEAFVGAIYLDRGYKFAEHFIINRVIKNYVNLTELETTDTNYKSQLIEWAQKFKREINFYTDLEAYDSKYFVSYVKIDHEILGSGSGKSKKEAEQNAAQQTLEKVDVHENLIS